MTSQEANGQLIDDTSSNGTSVAAIMACNSVSIFVCFITLSLYTTLSLKNKYKKLMRRTSLTLAACMASSDLILHCSNLAGYRSLPPGFACAFVGGWLFACPSMLSIFYSCCIALNSQLAFVFRRRTSSRALAYFIIIPILVAFLITFCALGTGTYGYDETWGYCWYATQGVPSSTVLLRMVLTYSLPTLLCMLYLLVATITISFAVFGQRSAPIMTRSKYPSISTSSDPHTFPPSSPLDTSRYRSAPTVATDPSDRPQQYSRDRKPPSISGPQAALQMFTGTPLTSPAFPKRSRSSESQPSAHVRIERVQAGPSRKTIVMRQLTVRLIGYIVTPILCLLPGIILDLLTKVFPDMEVPFALNALFDGLNGLVGLFNSLLMLSDPALLAVWADLLNKVTARDYFGEKLVRRLLGASEKTSGGATGGEVLGRGKQRRGDLDDDVLASGFGLGARTRIDHFEDEDMREKGEQLHGDPSRGMSQLGIMEEGEEMPVVQYPVGRDSDTHSQQTNDRVVSTDGDRVRRVDIGRGSARGAPQGLEVHVRVDVTRRMSRVKLMEDWLSGL